MNLESLVEKFKSERIISLIEYAQELTENDFEFILEFFKSFNCHWCLIDLNSNQEIKFNESKFKEEINSLMNSNKERNRLYDNLPRGALKCEPNNFQDTGVEYGICIPRKGMIYKTINKKGDKNAEYFKLLKERKNIKRPKFFMFNWNKKNSEEKKAKKQIKNSLETHYRSILTPDLVKDYYALKNNKRINFKEYF